ncbi:3-deoxy-manno-octulosonate-8-phosphatase KdsC [Algicola sagamiensis]|uniref:3-deoxy-manno-octulosonate-8-phosphatase KdsC n=1 Tax=Algicola sagamiensis TaxID=163869 RepID=UPI0003708120|nr:3-deoxy-manno-octulosonate-8-phosphatase KdsC [Algicola sagamiensis]
MRFLFEEMYQNISDEVWHKAQQIRLLICDVDGVFSDGLIFLGNQGEEYKAFNTKDGLGVKSLIHSGIEVAIITGRRSTIVEKRMTTLGVQHIYQGQENKLEAYQDLLQKLSLSHESIAYIGDDTADLPVMQNVGLSVAVNDAHPYVKMKADFTTHCKGGYGAVRELSDLLLCTQDKFEIYQGSST